MPYKDRNKRIEYAKKYYQEHIPYFTDYHAQPENKEKRAERERGYKYSESYKGSRVFVGVDGEGHGEGLDHKYYVLRVGSAQLVTGEPLTSQECLEFLADAPTGKGLIYCIYYGTYDCTMWLRDLPKEIVSSILNREARSFKTKYGSVGYHPVVWQDYTMDYIPRKRFQIRRGKNPYVVVHDVGGFFQEPFIFTKEDGTYDGAVIKWDVVTPEEAKILADGKLARGNFDALSTAVDKYNSLECDVLSRLMEKLNNATLAVGLDASPFEGAGNLAGSMYQQYVGKPHAAKKESPYPPLPPETMPAMGAYYGGRFEISAHGPIRRKVYEYDIASAYPHAMLALPCLWHGTWQCRDEGRGYRLSYLSWYPRRSDVDCTWGPFPFRHRDGSITYPKSGQGWYWSPEWDDELVNARYHLQHHEVWSFVPDADCDCTPFDWIRGIYERRKQLGKSGKGMVLKLGLNSLYGKTAQTVGQAPWRNSVNAGLITSITRARIRNAIYLNPEACIMAATDGIYSLEPLPLDIGTNLGDWELKELENLHIVQPGVYFDSDNAKVKTRGISRRDLVKYRQEVIDAFDLITEIIDDDIQIKPLWGTTVTYSGLITLSLAYSQNHPEKAGYFGHLTRKVTYNCEPKRPLHSLHQRDGIWRSYSPDGNRSARSMPYSPVRMPVDIIEESLDGAEGLEALGIPTQQLLF